MGIITIKEIKTPFFLFHKYFFFHWRLGSRFLGIKKEDAPHLKQRRYILIAVIVALNNAFYNPMFSAVKSLTWKSNHVKLRPFLIFRIQSGLFCTYSSFRFISSTISATVQPLLCSWNHLSVKAVFVVKNNRSVLLIGLLEYHPYMTRVS